MPHIVTGKNPIRANIDMASEVPIERISMKQPDIDRSVAKSTGESVAFIKALGFSLLHLPAPPASRARGRRIFSRRRQPPPADRKAAS